jgi:Zn-dependent protease
MSVSVCANCQSALDASELSCPNCNTLTRSAELQQLAEQARAAGVAGQLVKSRELWQQAIALLPENTVQYRSIQARITDLDQRIADGQAHTSSVWKKAAAGIGPVALIIWKFKAIALIIVTKGKLLLLGLTKMSTLLSMFASFGLYWALYGWAFGLGLVISIYIHEMGHVVELRKFGIPAGAPMFIPGFGAMILLRNVVLSPIQDSRIGLAGPLYGLGAGLCCLGMYALTGAQIWNVLAHFGAVINLFNLIPVWQLDGARGLSSLNTFQRRVILGTAVVLWFITSQPMLLLIAMGATYRLFTKDAAEVPDQTGFMQFIGLLVALAALMVFAPLK